MNRLSPVLAVVVVMAIMCQPSGLMAQDPNDPGEPDTVYLAPGGMHSPNGDTLYICPDLLPEDVTIYINICNDNDVSVIYVPLIDDCNGPPCSSYLDPSKNNFTNEPKCFEGSRVEYFDVVRPKLELFPPFFAAYALVMWEDPLPPGEGLYATLIFTVSDTGRICLDTVFYPQGNPLHFVINFPESLITYTPVFHKRTFVISNCEYSPADPNYDWTTDLTDLVYLINYVLKHGPSPCVLESGDMNCDGSVTVVDIVYFVNYLFRDGPAPGYCP